MADAGSLFDSPESEDSIEYGCYSVTVIFSKPEGELQLVLLTVVRFPNQVDEFSRMSDACVVTNADDLIP